MVDLARSASQTATAFEIPRSAAHPAAARFRTGGEWGLVDRREDNDALKLSYHALAKLDHLVRRTRGVWLATADLDAGARGC